MHLSETKNFIRVQLATQTKNQIKALASTLTVFPGSFSRNLLTQKHLNISTTV